MSLRLDLSPSLLRAAVQDLLDNGGAYLPTDLYRQVLGDPTAELETIEDVRAFVALVNLTKQSIQSAAAATRGRPSRAIPAEKWKVSMRQDLALFTDMVLADPVRGNLGYGKRSALLEELLLNWARKRGFKG